MSILQFVSGTIEIWTKHKLKFISDKLFNSMINYIPIIDEIRLKKKDGSNGNDDMYRFHYR